MTSVLLTGATGTMGRATLAELRARGIAVRAFVLPGESLPRELRGPDVEVAEGDLRDADAVRAAVRGVDTVLHVAALVSPTADDRPELAWAINLEGTRNLVEAVRAEGPHVRLVAVGSVAESGDRPAPVHWGRVGDPLAPSPGDAYAQTKIAAELAVVDSGLPRWLWLRQTGILHAGLLTTIDPIMTHAPLDGVLEWVSDRDSGRLMALIAQGAMPEEGWNEVYDIGGGAGWRHTNAYFYTRLGRAMGVANILRWFDRRWFATRGFHGQWFTDSDRLAALVPFRSESFDGALARIVDEAPWYLRLARLAPAGLVRRFVTGPQVRAERGTMHAVENDEDAARGFFGTRDAWEEIGDWAQYEPARPSRRQDRLDHGYDETIAPADWDEPLVRGAAAFRGGELREGFTPGLPRERAAWRCAEGHEFSASPWAVLRAGHWCPRCVREPADYARQARANRFLAQVAPGAE